MTETTTALHGAQRSNDALNALGYDNDAELVKISLKGDKMIVGQPSPMKLTPSGSVTWSGNEFSHGGFRCNREYLFVPGATQFVHVAPLGFTPSLHVYATPDLVAEAKVALKKAMMDLVATELKRLDTEADKLRTISANLQEA